MKKDFISPLSDFGFHNLFGTERGKENLRRSRYSALDEDERLAYDRWLKHENDRLLEREFSRQEPSIFCEYTLKSKR